MRRLTLASAIVLAASLVPAQNGLAFEPPRSAIAELPGERTPTSRTWQLRNGQVVTQIAGRPEQWKDDAGRWHDLYPGVKRRGSDWEARSGRTTVSLPGSLGGRANGAISLTGARGHVVSLSIGHANSTGSVEGGTITYRDARPETDIKLDVIAGGFKETVTLKDRAAPRSLTYRLDTGSTALRVLENGNGGASVMDGDEAVFSIAEPAVIDADQRVSVNARLAVSRAGKSAWTLRTVLDDEWLDAPGRAWPVTVDPTIADVNSFRSVATDDCQSYYGNDAAPSLWKPSAFPEWHACNLNDWRSVGHHPDGIWWYAGYQLLRFNTLTLIQSDQIASARLSLYRDSSSTPNRSDVGVYPLTAQTSTITTPPTADRNRFVLGRYDERQRLAAIPAGPTGSVDVDVTGIVTQWRRHAESSGRAGRANFGLLLQHEDLVHRETDNSTTEHGPSWCRVQACDRTFFGSSTNPVAARRPLLEVTSWPAAPAGSGVVSPTEGELSGRWIRLQARSAHSSVTTARFQYIAGGGSAWRDIPLSALRGTDRAALTSQDVPFVGDRSRMIVWDVAATPGGDVDGPVRVRAFLESPTLGHGGMTEEVEARLDRRGVARSATVPFGPGDVDLTTGEFSMSAQDAAFEGYLQDLSLRRTYTSRGVAKRNADMFGPGWEGSVDPDGGELPYKGIYNFSRIEREVIERQEIRAREWDWEQFWGDFLMCIENIECEWENPDGPGYTVETLEDIDTWEYRYAVLELGDGTKTSFTQTVDPSGQVTGWVPMGDMAGFRLQHNATRSSGVFEFVLTDPSGGVATFSSEAPNSPNYRLRNFQQAGSPTALTYTFEPAGNRQRLKRVTAPYPTGGTPRWMEFDWTAVGCPAIGTCEPWRVTGVRVGTGNEAGTQVAAYGYSEAGRLAWAADPRQSPYRITSYGYNSRGLLSVIAPPGGDAPWGLAYTTRAGDDGPRLESVTRPHPSGGAAVRTIRYDVPLTGAGAPYNMSVAETARWAQIDNAIPWDAVAIFPADDLPNATSPNYRRATVYYTDADARVVNVARPGGRISTVEYDANDNVVRELSAGNRARALAAGATSPRVAHDLSTIHQYAANGIDRVATFGPLTQIERSNGTTVTGRRLSTFHFDENAPAGGPYHLPTSEWRAIDLGNGNRVDEQEVVRYGYGAFGGMSGWTARTWTERIVDPEGRRLTSFRFLHPTYPVIEEIRTPGGAAGGARPDVRYHQYADIAPVRVPAAVRGCRGGLTIPSGFQCLDTDNMAARSQDRRFFGYDGLGRVTHAYESNDGWDLDRMTINSYHSDDELAQTLSIAFDSTSIGTSYSTDPATGRIVRVADGSGLILREYDSNGRLSRYTDASGTVTRYQYDLRGRVTSAVENDSRTTTFAYDDRDDVVSITEPGLDGPITATYDHDGNLSTETLPGGLELTQTYDSSGNLNSANWVKAWNCWSGCTVSRSEVLARDLAGRIVRSETNGQQETATYDTAGRLASTDMRDAVAEVCTRTAYAFDGGGSGDSNRTGMETRVSARAGACGTGTATNRSWAFDSADRVTSAGWVFDRLGRATTVPAPDSGGTGALTASFYADDRVRELTLDGRTHAYRRDPLRRTQGVTSSGGGKPNASRTYTYADDGSKPTSTGGQRNITGPGGVLVATVSGSSGVTLMVRDVQGNIVEKIPVTASGLLLGSSGSTRYGAFGLITKAAPAVVDWTSGVGNYGWLGAHQLSTEFEQRGGGAPAVEMGARVYLPAVGRFLQRDPVRGGSVNDYAYVFQDPLNYMDLGGALTISGSDLGAAVKRAAKERVKKLARKVNTGFRKMEDFVMRCFLGTTIAGVIALTDAVWEYSREVDIYMDGRYVYTRERWEKARRAAHAGITAVGKTGPFGITAACLEGNYN